MVYYFARFCLVIAVGLAVYATCCTLVCFVGCVCRLFVGLLVVNIVDCSGSFILCVLVMLVAICAWLLALLVVMICCCFGVYYLSLRVCRVGVFVMVHDVAFAWMNVLLDGLWWLVCLV